MWGPQFNSNWAWPAGRLAAWMTAAGRLAGWLAGWLAGRAGWLADWLAGWGGWPPGGPPRQPASSCRIREAVGRQPAASPQPAAAQPERPAWVTPWWRLVPGSRVAPAGVGSAWVPRGGWVVPHWSLGADPEHGRGADPRLHAGHGLGSDHRVESEHGLDWHPRRDADRRLGADHRLDPEHGLDSDHRLRAEHGLGSDHRLDPDHRLDSDHKPGSRRRGGQAQIRSHLQSQVPFSRLRTGAHFYTKQLPTFRCTRLITRVHRKSWQLVLDLMLRWFFRRPGHTLKKTQNCHFCPLFDFRFEARWFSFGERALLGGMEHFWGLSSVGGLCAPSVTFGTWALFPRSGSRLCSADHVYPG